MYPAGTGVEKSTGIYACLSLKRVSVGGSLADIGEGMASPARFESREHLAALRGMAAKLKDHPRTTGMFARLAFFFQQEQVNLSMAERLTRTDRQFGPLIETAFQHSLHLLTNQKYTNVSDAMKHLGDERSRRIFTTVAYGWWATFALPRAAISTTLLLQQAAAIGHVSALISQPSKGESPDVGYSAGLAAQCGIPLMAALHGERYGKLLASMDGHAGTLPDYEQDCFGYTHATAGAVLLETIGASETLIDAVNRSHQPMDSLSGLALRISIGETTALHMGYDGGTGLPAPEIPSTWLIRLGVKAFDVPSLSVDMAREAALAACYFGA